jgi:hypothetical protein
MSMYRCLRSCRTYANIVSNLEDELCFRCIPFYAVACLAEVDKRRFLDCQAENLTVLGALAYSDSASCWNDCQVWMYTMAGGPEQEAYYVKNT